MALNKNTRATLRSRLNEYGRAYGQSGIGDTCRDASEELARLQKVIGDAHALVQRKQYHVAEDILFNRGVRYFNRES